MKAFIVYLTILIPNQLLFSQTYFNNNYENNSNISIGSTVIEIDSGGYIFPGYIYGSGYSSFVIIKLNPFGDTLWTKEYRKSLSSFSGGASNSIIKTKDYKYVFSGSFVDSTNNRNALLVKIRDNGDTVWTKTYGGTSFDNANIVCQTPDSGYVLMGVTQSFSNGPASDFYLVKTDKIGNLQWQRAYGTTSSEECISGQITLDGGFILSGSQSTGSSSSNFYIVKTDFLGNLQWQHTYSNTNGVCFIKQLHDSSYILTGAQSVSGMGYQGCLLKINKAGSFIWQKNYGGNGDDWFYSIPLVLSDGSIVVAGQQTVGGNPIGMLVKTDDAGNQQWLRTYYKDISSDNYFYDVRHTNDNGFIMSGDAVVLSADPWLVKVDSNGCEYAGCNVGIEELRVDGGEIEIYPNPATNELILTTTNQSLKTIRIYNILGEEVLKLERIANSQKAIDISTWNAGVYFVEVETEKGVIRKKLVKE